MSDFVTSAGLTLPTLAEIKTQLETDFIEAFGTGIDLSPEGPFGQFISIMSKSISDAYLAAQEIYTARHPNEATGTSLDNISAETGVRRIDATATRVENAVLYGTEGTIVSAGSLVRRESSTIEYSLDADVTITSTSLSDIALKPNDTTPGLSVEFTVNSDTVAYVVQALDTEEDIVDGLLLDAATSLAAFISNGGTVAKVGTDTIRAYHPDTSISASWNTYLDLEEMGASGDFEATTTGPNVVPISTLNTITTPLAGWDRVDNPFFEGTVGRDTETDTELRVRRSSTLNAGSATEENIRAQLLNSVEGVSAALVASNRTLVTDGEGRPAKSFEAIVEGGTDADVALTIWNHMPAGILSFGSTAEDITDTSGGTQTINFSRPTQKYLHVKVKRSIYSEETYPADGDEAIKQAIEDWAALEYELGTDVLYQRLSTPIFTVEGISSVEITVDLTDAPGDTPTLVASNIAVASREIVIASTTRITVEDL